MSAGNAPGRREVAHRLFAAEFDDADFSYSESDEERAPNYVVVPTGARVNRLFFAGVLTETERVNEDMLRARVVDPTGAFVTYAGQYQPDELAFLERADPPAYLAVTGKARTFQPEDSDRVFTSVRPESISEVDAETRDRWVVQAAERTIERVEVAAAAIDSGRSGDALREALEEAGVDPSLAAGIPLALDHYGTTPAYLAGLRELAEDALAMVAGEVDEVGTFDIAPGEGAGDAATLADPQMSLAASEPATDAGGPGDATKDEAVAGGETERAAGTGGDEAAGSDAGPVADEVADAEAPTSPDAGEGGDEIGDFEPATGTGAGETGETGGAGEASATDAAESAIDPETSDDGPAGEEFDPAEDDVLSEAERQEVEDELGTDFSSGNEVGEPGEADVGGEPTDSTDSTDPSDTHPEGGGGTSAEETGTEPGDRADEPVEESPEEKPDQAVDAETEPTDTGEASADVPLDEAVMDAMRELDDGDGADRDAIVEAVTERTGASPEEVGDAIQDALMSGQCYEPDDDVFKPI